MIGIVTGIGGWDLWPAAMELRVILLLVEADQMYNVSENFRKH